MSYEQQPLRGTFQSLRLAGFMLAACALSGCSFMVSESGAQVAANANSAGMEKKLDEATDPASATPVVWHQVRRISTEAVRDDFQAVADRTRKKNTPSRHVDHVQPKTLQEAVLTVLEMDETIRRAFAANDGDSAHGELHQIGHVLKSMNGLVATADLTGRQRVSVQISVVKLFEAYASVDATMHGKEGVSYDEVSLEIEENLQTLKDICSRPKG